MYYPEETLRKIILTSGGHLRDLLKLIYDSCNETDDRIQPNHAEVAMNQLEKKQQNLRHIDPFFSSKQANIWTGDKTDTGRVWFVSFSIGNLADSRGPIDGIYVRPVRSGSVKGKLYLN